MSSITAENGIQETTTVLDEVTVQSQVDFFGLEYTEPYYLKSENKWYCLVYLYRDDAWEQFKPQIDIKKNSFTGLYNNIEKETDPFIRLALCQKAWSNARELLEKLEYGRIISPKDEAAYQIQRDQIANIPVLFEEAKQNCTIYLKINADYNKTLTGAITTALSDKGFQLTKTHQEATYTAEVSVDDNVTGSDPLSITPSVSVKLISASGKTVYTLEVSASEKAVSYSLEGAQKKAYPKFAQDIQEAVKNTLSGTLQ